MKSQEIETLNELLEKLRLGEIEGTVEIRITSKGKLSRIIVKRKDEKEVDTKEEITHKVIELQLKKPELQVDVSHLEVEAHIPGFDLHGSNFTYSKVINSDLLYNNLKDVPFYKAFISQSNVSSAYGLNLDRAYATGSVNLYNTQSSVPEIVNPLDAPFQAHDHDHGGYY